MFLDSEISMGLTSIPGHGPFSAFKNFPSVFSFYPRIESWVPPSTQSLCLLGLLWSRTAFISVGFKWLWHFWGMLARYSVDYVVLFDGCLCLSWGCDVCDALSSSYQGRESSIWLLHGISGDTKAPSLGSAPPATSLYGITLCTRITLWKEITRPSLPREGNLSSTSFQKKNSFYRWLQILL